MSEILQVQIATDEEAVSRFGKDYERSLKRSAYSALADKMMDACSVTETIVDPDAEGAEDYAKYGRKRYYRFSVLVGNPADAEALVKARQKGVEDALEALTLLLKQPNDYEGEMRSYFLRWLGPINAQKLEYVLAETRDR